MDRHIFGQGPGHLPQRADEIAERRGAWLVNFTDPNGTKRHWFACKNKGEPFNGRTAAAVLDDLMRAGLIACVVEASP